MGNEYDLDCDVRAGRCPLFCAFVCRASPTLHALTLALGPLCQKGLAFVCIVHHYISRVPSFPLDFLLFSRNVLEEACM